MGGTANAAQAAHWNDRAGRTWVDLQPLLDRMFAGFVPLLIEPLGPDMRAVLDIGCGAGALTLAAAERIGPAARCTGVDISAPLAAAAESRAVAAGRTGITFDVADAQTYSFEAGGFDAVVSRFGVMFFDDPVAAFSNLRRATRPGGLLRFAAWRSPQENAFMGVPKRAVGHLVDFPLSEPNAPGQFGFADRNRVLGILADAGWRDVRVDPVDAPCSIPAGDVIAYGTRMGALGAVWADLSPSLREEIDRLLRTAFQAYEADGDIRFTAACWLVRATA
jgi:SAM-dependent methyltransferase